MSCQHTCILYNYCDFIFFGIPWYIGNMIMVVTYQNSMFLYLYYFHMITYYFKLKLRRKNIVLKMALNHLDKRLNFMKFLANLNKLYTEINQVNCEFWAKFLSISLAFYLTYISGLFYGSFFAGLEPYIQSSYLLYFIFNLLIILIFIASTASMSSEADKAYLPIHTIYLFVNLNFTNKLKVKNKYE